VIYAVFLLNHQTKRAVNEHDSFIFNELIVSI